MLASPSIARAQIVPPSPECATVGAVVTCTGDLAAGVLINNSPIYKTLNVTPTLGSGAEITPASGVDGIRFTSRRNFGVTVNSKADITVSGDSADGIDVVTNSGGPYDGGSITITSTGAITSESGRGIAGTVDSDVRNLGHDVSITNNGAITARKQGISARSWSGKVTIDTTGKIISSDNPATEPLSARYSRGIMAFTENAGASAVDIKNKGDIEATSNGIYAYAGGGSITIDSTGDIRSGIGQSQSTNYGDGIFARTIENSTNPAASVGNITITNTGNIQAAGRGSGILAYSINADSAIISVTHHDDGTITGGDGDLDGHAIFVYGSSIAEDGTITATVTTSGILKGGGTNGAGINFLATTYSAGAKMDGTVVITATGEVEGGNGIDGTAIRSYAGGYSDTSASVTVKNSGKVTGSVSLSDVSGTGTNIFENMFGGLFNMGSFAYLGDGNELRNAGTLSPGGAGKVATTQLTGDLVQHAGGTMLIDVDGDTNTADRINVTGTADLAGTVTVNVINPVSTDQQFTILSAAGGVTNSGLTLAGGLPVGFSLLYPNANDLVLGVTVDFSLDEGDLNRNQTRLAENLNDIIDAGAGGVSPVTNALLGITNLDQYRDALNQLLPEHYLNLQAATLFAAEDFAQSLMSCREREGAYAVIAEGQCLWVEADASRLEQDGTKEQVSSEEDSYRFAAGGQFGFSEQWHMGFALRYETLKQDTGDFASSDGQRVHAGAAFKFNEGPLLLAGAVSAGRTWYDTERDFNFGGFADSASSSHEVDYVNGLLRAAYLLPLGDFHLKPIADLNVTHVSWDGFTEDDGGGAALDVDDADGTHVSFSPALEAGAEWRLASGTLLRPFIGGGVTWYGDNAFTGSASFADGPEDAGSFETRTEIDEVMANVAAGIDILGVNGFDLRLRYEGAFGETVTSQSLALRATMKF